MRCVKFRHGTLVTCQREETQPLTSLSSPKQVRFIDPVRQRKVYQSIVRQLDAVENKARPEVTVSAQSVSNMALMAYHLICHNFPPFLLQFDFGDVQLNVPQTQVLDIRNTGQVRHFNMNT